MHFQSEMHFQLVVHVVLGNDTDLHDFQLNSNVHARRSTEAHAAKAMAPLRSMTGFAGNFENMTGEDDETCETITCNCEGH